MFTTVIYAGSFEFLLIGLTAAFALLTAIAATALCGALPVRFT